MKTLLGITNILSWIIFIGLCIQTGALLFSYCVSMFIHSEAAKNINLDLDLFISVIANVFKRGTELQSENELTI